MINGIINVYKEKGFTSHDVVARMRKITGQKKIGHTGTLDPDAEGVLPVCLGRATKLCDMLTDRDKTYEAVLLLGKETDTQDISGRILKECDTSLLTEKNTENCIKSFEGEYDQIPPMYSALKVNGKKLCDLAREGKTVERQSRRVHIYKIRIIEIRLPRVKMEVECSKGTYIRTLCSDIGEALGTGGCMESLVRTRAGVFGISESICLSDIEKMMLENRFEEILLPVDQMFSEFRKIFLSGRNQQLAYNGNPFVWIPGEKRRTGENQHVLFQPVKDEKCRVYDENGNFIGIYRYDGKSGFRLEKMFLDPEKMQKN